MDSSFFFGDTLYYNGVDKIIGNSLVVNLFEMGPFSIAALLLVMVLFGYYKWKF
jgi:hypothetical protein